MTEHQMNTSETLHKYQALRGGRSLYQVSLATFYMQQADFGMFYKLHAGNVN